jgi:hypothetical protein
VRTCGVLDGMQDRLRTVLAGAPPTLPPLLDRAAETWAGWPPRARLAASVVGALLLLAIAGAGAGRSPWGPSVEVLVATRDLPAGHELTAADVAARAWPRTLRPAGALTAVAGERPPPPRCRRTRRSRPRT